MCVLQQLCRSDTFFFEIWPIHVLKIKIAVIGEDEEDKKKKKRMRKNVVLWQRRKGEKRRRQGEKNEREKRDKRKKGSACGWVRKRLKK